jgi:hypothetical protein
MANKLVSVAGVQFPDTALCNAAVVRGFDSQIKNVRGAMLAPNQRTPTLMFRTHCTSSFRTKALSVTWGPRPKGETVKAPTAAGTINVSA